MPLNASGPISIGGSTTGQSINLELGRAATASSNLNESALRSLAGVPSGAISLSNFYGKSNFLSAGTITVAANSSFYGFRRSGSPTIGSITTTTGPQVNQFYSYTLPTVFNQFSTASALTGDPANISIAIQGGPTVTLARSSPGVYLLSGTSDIFNFVARVGQSLTFTVSAV